MANRSDDFKKQVNELWAQAIEQLEDVKERVLRSSDRFEGDIVKLRMERDKLLTKLGEQTYRLANQGKLPMPHVVKQTVDRLNEVIDTIIAKGGAPGPAKKKTKKTAAKKKTTKTAGKKKTTSKKTTASKSTSRKKKTTSKKTAPSA